MVLQSITSNRERSMRGRSGFSVSLFYSYSHKDQKYREEMEKALTLLKVQDEILQDWSDRRILPGESISKKIEQQFAKTDVFVFLVSMNFIASQPCRDEWNRACELAELNPTIVLVPIILSDCSWRDFENMGDKKALPEDGKPINSFRKPDVAWQQVYVGLKEVIENFRTTFTIKEEFQDEIESTEFLARENIKLQDLFVFPNLVTTGTDRRDDNVEKPIYNLRGLMGRKHILIHGERLSGKTALCRYLILHCVENDTPVMYIDLDGNNTKIDDRVCELTYQEQFYGDYCLWKTQRNKTLVLDNYSPGKIGNIASVIGKFDNVLMTTSTEIFSAYCRDDERLATFNEVRIDPFKHGQQERLIRQRATLLYPEEQILDGRIDQMEYQINEVIINKKILPRYPFYILTILQTYESFMPTDLTITSYGHCYYILILTHFRKTEIPYNESEIDACLNFLEQLSFEIYSQRRKNEKPAAFLKQFEKRYARKFLPFKRDTLNRLCNADYGILDPATGQFRKPYFYYYFLGRYFAHNGNEHKELMSDMISKSYIERNALTLIFTIHHAQNDLVIDELLTNNLVALEEFTAATLNKEETKVFDELLDKVPTDLRSKKTVAEERKQDRLARDKHEDALSVPDEMNHDEIKTGFNNVYKIMKNNEILGQLIKNKHGSLTREKLIEIIEIVVESGLRLVSLGLVDATEIRKFANLVRKRNPQWSVERIQWRVRLGAFLWIILNLHRIISAMNKPEIRPLLTELILEKNTPAYDLIGYFLQLDTGDTFLEKDRSQLSELLNKHRYLFFEKLMVIETYHYLNTHTVEHKLKQQVYSLLKNRYYSRRGRYDKNKIP